MAALTLTDIPVEEISRRAEQIRFGRFLLGLVAWLFYVIGYSAAVLMTVVVWRSVRFTAASVLTGWKAANGPSKRDQIAQLKARVAAQDMQLSRFAG